MTNELKDVGTNDTVPYERDNNMMTKVKWSTETNDIDDRFLRDYENMHKSMEDRQINDFNEAQRHIQSAMMGDTPVKTMSSSILPTDSSSPVVVIMPCPESQVTDPEWGSWSTIHFRSSSWDSAINLAPGGVPRGGRGGSSSQSSSSPKVDLLVVNALLSASL